MNWKKFFRVLAALFLAVATAFFMWTILGSIGYSRMGLTGAEIALIIPIIFGLILFFVLNWLFKQLYQ